MKINIVTVCNSSYFIFLKIWLRSFHATLNLDNIKTIYVINTGLLKSEIEFVKSFPNTEIVDTGLETEFTGLHEEGWSSSTYSKLPVIKRILASDKIPTYFVDVDCIFVRDFYELLDFSRDLVVCDCSDRQGGYHSRLIGSFYGFNSPDRVIPFIDSWYNKILYSKAVKHAWRESPSLTLTWEEELESGKHGKSAGGKQLLMQGILEGVISASFLSRPMEVPYILHMKSEGGYGYSTPEERLRMPYVQEFIGDYLDKEDHV